MKKNKPFEMPEQLLNNIDECSNGGFALFTFDDEGTPAIHFKFDNQKDAYAILENVKLWSNGMDVINQQMTINNIMESFQPSRRKKKGED